MLKLKQRYMKTLLLALSMAFGLTACSTPSATLSTGAQLAYTDSWWYDDYWYYQYHMYPNCCDSDGDFKDAVNSWWNTLDADKQAEIKDKVDNWRGDGPDLSALKTDFNKKWQALPADKKQEVTQKRQQIQDKMSGNSLSVEQKQAVRQQWQSKQRPTLQRAPQRRMSMPSARPQIRSHIPRARLGGGRRH
ncbi:hypothetical protein [Oceanisphaera pacifica]|uniref:Lipoprotein n=1 Tax=Oceanisphaera pacifica TaxID=2818389 RepID=A0ABS3NFE9_9GAMM|nr:hypothetical protein [Oceanisphaera pacifica]MBO1519108.1 hypothetical protein [Oceanisphaera pacifica]